ncbi:hypothetical protein J4456_03590 [Candidatus Pacearchaeota archaeon]|nr:hypothetical protein [Candidatus Pacearchaeota archaeon]
MEQEIKINAKEIMEKLSKLQEDIEYIKKNMKTDEISLDEEMKLWEQASEEDIAEFNRKHNL